MADFVRGDELDDLFLVIENDLFWEDEEFKSDNKSVAELSSPSDVRCSLCDQVCKNSRGLACNIKSTHSTQDTLVSSYFGLNDFSQLIVNSVEKLKCKEYLPDEVLGEFNCITFNDSMS